MADFPSISSDFDFTITVEQCVPWLVVPDYVVPIQYSVNNAAETYTITSDDVYDDNECGFTATYTALYWPDNVAGIALSAPLSFSTDTLSVYTTDSNDEEIYNIEFTVTLDDDAATAETFEIYVYVGAADCSTDTVSWSVSSESHSYTLDAGEYVTTAVLTNDLEYCPIEYTHTVTNSNGVVT